MMTHWTVLLPLAQKLPDVAGDDVRLQVDAITDGATRVGSLAVIGPVP